MQKISPVCSNTIVSSDPHVWTPRTFDDFLKELDHVVNSCEGKCPLFRGHADSKWLLESSFVRTCKMLLFGIAPHIRPSKEIRQSVEYNQAFFSLLLLKYDVLVKPSVELRNLERSDNIDALFELMKRFQQYPEEDKTTLKGTFFLDWSHQKDVGLFFAHFDSDEHCAKSSQTDGALYICDKTATGKTLQNLKVQEIINKMRETLNENRAFGCPLLFYPEKQILCQRANNQDAIYWAQMDLRYDLEDIWKLQEKDTNKGGYIFIKLILPYEYKNGCSKYLLNKNITHTYLFPKS
jgi:hypothetical protein